MTAPFTHPVPADPIREPDAGYDPGPFRGARNLLIAILTFGLVVPWLWQEELLRPALVVAVKVGALVFAVWGMLAAGGAIGEWRRGLEDSE